MNVELIMNVELPVNGFRVGGGGGGGWGGVGGVYQKFGGN